MPISYDDVKVQKIYLSHFALRIRELRGIVPRMLFLCESEKLR